MSEQTSALKKRNEQYNKYVETVTPKTSIAKALWHSFWIGGVTCMILVTLAILFTGLGFYDVIARQGGAGSFLPITGFANAMASASMEFKTEGLIFGTSVKLFSVVGPVVVNGIVWSTLAGLINLLILGMY